MLDLSSVPNRSFGARIPGSAFSTTTHLELLDRSPLAATLYSRCCAYRHEKPQQQAQHDPRLAKLALCPDHDHREHSRLLNGTLFAHPPSCTTAATTAAARADGTHQFWLKLWPVRDWGQHPSIGTSSAQPSEQANRLTGPRKWHASVVVHRRSTSHLKPAALRLKRLEVGGVGVRGCEKVTTFFFFPDAAKLRGLCVQRLSDLGSCCC